MLTNTSKGITPVIAIVLLLLVTVGAVGVVYTQFQGLVQDPDTGFLEEVEIDFQTVTRNTTSPDTMSIRIQNQGEEQYNLSDVARMEYSVPGEQRLEFDTADVLDGVSTDGSQQQCLTDTAPNDIQEFRPGTTASCNTGVEMASPGNPITIHLVDSESGEEINSYTCEPSTSTSATC
jgi:FlaG/FlaF family flagellin (archaellin)